MAPKTAGRRRGSSTPTARLASTAPSTGRSLLAQVRLRAEEAAELKRAMELLELSSTSDALREGLRLLSREAAEVAAAEEIRAYYHGELAPVPEGVAAASDADLAAADEAEW